MICILTLQRVQSLNSGVPDNNTTTNQVETGKTTSKKIKQASRNKFLVNIILLYGDISEWFHPSGHARWRWK